MRRKRLKSVGIAAVVVFVLVALAVLLAPTVLSGVVRGRIERELASRLDATVRVGGVSLGWFSPQRVEDLVIEGLATEDLATEDLATEDRVIERASNERVPSEGVASGDPARRPRDSVRASLEVREGLWALLTGDEVHAVVEARAETSIDREGAIGLAKLVRAAEAPVPPQTTARPAATDGAASILGGRRVTIELAEVSLVLEAPDARRIELNDLGGRVALSESVSGALGAELELSAKTLLKTAGASESGGAVAARAGSLAVESGLELPRRADGSFDLAQASASAKLDASGVPLPSAAGEVLLEDFALAAELAAGGALRVAAKGGARVAGAEPASVDATVRVASLFDAAGAVSLDPAAIEAQAEVRALPLAALQVFAPTVGDARIDLVADVGPRADLSLRKAARGEASVAFESQRVRLRFEGRVSDDGSAIEGGTLLASAALRPELVRALAGLETTDSLAFTVEGDELAWRGGTKSGAPGDFAGAVRCELARPIAVRGPLEVSLDRLELGVRKGGGGSEARVTLGGGGVVGPPDAGGRFTLELGGLLDAKSGALRDGMVDARLTLAREVVASLTKALPADAVVVRGEAPTLRVNADAIALAASNAPSNAASSAAGGDAWARFAERLALRARVELGGAIECGLAGSPLAVSGAAVDVSIAAPGSSVTVDAGARVDGASLRVTQQLPRLPAALPGASAQGGASIGGLASLGASGVIELRSVDPALARRLAPAAGDAIRALGAGPISISARNASEAGAVRLEVAFDAQALDARATARLTDDAIALREVVVDGTLGTEALALLPKDAGVEIEPGAALSLRVESLALAKTPTSSRSGGALAAPDPAAAATSEWKPTGEVSARIEVPKLRVRRAPGFSQPLPELGLALVAGYAFATERATLGGEVAIGGDARDGRLALDLSWRKPLEAKLFAGVEGTVALTGFDPARLDAALGSDGLGARVAPSAILGGVGSVRVALEEKTEPRASVLVDFPKTRGSLSVAVREAPGARRASLEGTLSSTLSPESFEKLAGLDPASGRRVRAPVEASVGRIRLDAPLDTAMKPVLAEASIEVDASLSDLVLELAARSAPREGERSAAPPARVASGPLRLELRSERLSESLRVRLQSSGAEASAGSLDADLVVRGLLAGPEPTAAAQGGGDAARASQPAPAGGLAFDGTVRATRYPAATIDALAATGGAIQRYLGDAIDAEVTATKFELSSLRGDAAPAPAPGAEPEPGARAAGHLSLRIASEFAELVAPRVECEAGLVRIRKASPMTASLTMSPAVRDELLRSINIVFSDVQTEQRARFTVQSLAYPLDGDLRRMNANFRLEVGAVRLSNASWLAKALTIVRAEDTGGLAASIEPLEGRVARGRLTYRDFALRFGRTRQDGWKHSVVFDGDVDLAAKPVRVNALTTSLPLSDFGNWSSAVKDAFDRISAISPELAKSLKVGVRLSGPIADASGAPKALEQELALPEIDDIIKNDPSLLLKLGPALIGQLRKAFE